VIFASDYKVVHPDRKPALPTAAVSRRIPYNIGDLLHAFERQPSRGIA